MEREETPSARDRVLRLASACSIPETCSAITFGALMVEFSSRQEAESSLRGVWTEGLIAPLGAESDAEDGALVEVPLPFVDDPLTERSQFVLTTEGYAAVGRLHEVRFLLPERFDPSADEPTTAAQHIAVVTSFINDRLMRELKRDPNRMLSLSPRQFEELIAELFEREGFSVEITPRSKDGGRDVIAVRNDDLGSHLYLAECKRYSRDRPVGVSYVRALYGVMERERATRGILATTSYFSREARSFADDLKWRIGLKGYDELCAWLKRHGTG